MRSSAPKKAEAEFDDLLGQLVDELAMTPPSQSAVALVREPEPPKAHVASTVQMAAEAAAAAAVIPGAPVKPDNTLVKVVGIIAGSLTAVAVAALIVFGSGQSDPATTAATEVDDSAAIAAMNERAAADRAAAEQARTQAQLAARAEAEAEFARHEAARLAAVAASEKAAAKPKPSSKPRVRKPKPKPDPGGDFDAL